MSQQYVELDYFLIERQ